MGEYQKIPPRPSRVIDGLDFLLISVTLNRFVLCIEMIEGAEQTAFKADSKNI